MNKRDGGPAFPVTTDHKVASDLAWTCGMTLRDWFAGRALEGMLSYPDEDGIKHIEYARYAYSLADAMLAARKEENNDGR